jgi:hypothetical protein
MAGRTDQLVERRLDETLEQPPLGSEVEVAVDKSRPYALTTVDNVDSAHMTSGIPGGSEER